MNDKRRIFALVSDQETACHETALCSECYTELNRNKIESNLGVDVLSDSWTDCTDNAVLDCTVCGYSVDILAAE